MRPTKFFVCALNTLISHRFFPTQKSKFVKKNLRQKSQFVLGFFPAKKIFIGSLSLTMTRIWLEVC